jgi:uncharacterized protein YbcC (UPF0753/DUF2309 family)
MFMMPAQIAPARVSSLFKAAEAAARAIPPAFPLDATVAVNPFLGQTGEDLATVAARLGRVAGIKVTQPRASYAARIAAGEITDADLSEALAASRWAGKPANVAALKALLAKESPTPAALPTLADLAAGPTGIDWGHVIARCIGSFAAGHFDRGQALWVPAQGRGTFAAWREWALHDLTPEIAGLTGFCQHVGEAPDTPERAVLRACERLGIDEAAAESVFHRLLIDLGGWAQHGRWILWQAELHGGTDCTMTDLLAIRLTFEEALFALAPQTAENWTQTLKAHATPVAPNADQIADAILQEAAERASQRGIAAALVTTAPRDTRPAVQAAFCIDVRSEVFRRALEQLDPSIETIGFAGFFGLTVSHRDHGSDIDEAHLPVLLTAGLKSSSHTTPATEQASRIKARAVRAFGRFRQAAVSSFAFVEAAGPLYGVKLVGDALGLHGKRAAASPAPRIEPPLDATQKAATGAAVLSAMSMTKGHGRLILLLGHGAQVTNNPHESAYHCGACGGHTGEVSSRLLAALLNDPQTRAGLPALGIDIPADTLFVGGLHDTTTDEITLYLDAPSDQHVADIEKARQWLTQAGEIARAERARRLPGASAGSIAARALNWAEVRPEWGLAGCAAFIAGPRAYTAGGNLAGRAFLHSYGWQADKGFGTLELIITAPVVVASWISLQYYGSSVAPSVFGGGNKLIHNVTSGIGVVEGNGGLLRAGLPWQAVHDGEKLAHEPLRLAVMIEAPTAAITDVLAKHEGVRALFDNGWLHLFALEQGRIAARYRPGLKWEEAQALNKAA